jgi:hypothetical protein
MAKPRKLCEHETNGKKCGRKAVCVIQVKRGAITQKSADGEAMGRGVGSLWLPICTRHKIKYPDHEGFAL